MADGITLPEGYRLDTSPQVPQGFTLDQPGVGPQFPKGPPGSAPTQEEMDKAFLSTGKQALHYAPAIAGTIGAILAPELLPAAIPAWMAGVGGAGVGGAIGSGVKQTLGDHPASFTEGLKIAGQDAAEQAAMELGGRAVAKPLEWIGSALNPQRLYQSALNPSTRLAPKEVQSLVQTGLREKIPVSGVGYQKAVETTDALNRRIADIIQKKSDELGAVINPQSVAKRVDEARPTFEAQVNPEADLAALDRSQQEFLRQHTTYAPYTKIRPSVEEGVGYVPYGEGKTSIIEMMTPSRAQEIKQGTYAQLRKKYGELGTADVESQKSLARGLKEDIVGLFPELANLNARDSALISLEQELARHAVREGNKPMFGLGETIGIASGHPVHGLALGFLKRAIDSPEVKSKLAIALRRANLPTKLLQKGTKYALPAAARAAQATESLRSGRKTTIGPGELPNTFARGGRARDPLQRVPDRATILASLRGPAVKLR